MIIDFHSMFSVLFYANVVCSSMEYRVAVDEKQWGGVSITVVCASAVWWCAPLIFTEYTCSLPHHKWPQRGSVYPSVSLSSPSKFYGHSSFSRKNFFKPFFHPPNIELILQYEGLNLYFKANEQTAILILFMRQLAWACVLLLN